MAVCEIWDVRGRLDHPIDYAENPEKTANPKYTEADLQAMVDVMEYATNKEKTEQRYFVTGVNCDPTTARDEMMIAKVQWNDTSEIVCYHGFQSFKHGEVTPEQAHEVGVKLAERMWGDRFQVIVATHLNTDCLHNHFVVNSVSFADGMHYHDNKANLRLLRQRSDELCREYALSVIEHPSGKKKPYALYQAEKQGRPTRDNVARQAVDEAISKSFTLKDFDRQLAEMGYRINFDPNRKYWTIIGKGWQRPKRLYKLGEEYTNDRIMERISENSYVKVTIPVLPGSVKSMEKKYSEALCAYTEDQISTWTVNEYDSKNFYFDSDDGYSTYSITGLPAGLTSEVKGNALVVKGTPAAAGVSVATMTAKDELGNTLTKTITFLVGSATQIVGAATPVYTLATTADSNNVFKSPTVTGGSGNYRYTIVGDTGAAAKFEDPESDGSSYDGDIVAKVVAAGNYTVTLHVVDRENAALACDVQVVIHVAQGVSIVGMVKDAVGNAIPGAEIEYTNKNRADRYSTYASAMTDKDGAYSATVSAGTYDIAASYNDNSSYSDNAKAVNYLYKQDLTVSKSGFDIMLPLYKVALATTNQNTSLSGVTWYANHEKLGYGANLYLKAGVYNLESDTTGSSYETTSTGDYTWFNGGAITYTTTYTEKKFTASVNVANAPVQAIANEAVVGQKQSSTYTNKYSAAKDTTYVAELDSTYYLDATSASEEYYNDCYGAYKFVPSQDGTYSIDSSSDVCFYDENGTKLGNEKVTLTVGKTYIVGANDEDSDASFTIKKDAVVVPVE